MRSDAAREQRVLPIGFWDPQRTGQVVSELGGSSSNLRHPRALAPLPGAANAPDCILRIETYLVERAHEPVTLSDLSKLVNLSSRTLQTRFRAHCGCTPMEYLRTRRLELARQSLLGAPRASVTEVALACGFRHFGRFSIEYRKQFGESPSETRRKSHGAYR